MNKEKSEKKPTTRKRAPRSPKSVRLMGGTPLYGKGAGKHPFRGVLEKKKTKNPQTPPPGGEMGVLQRERAPPPPRIRYNVIDEVSFPLWRYTWKRTKK